MTAPQKYLLALLGGILLILGFWAYFTKPASVTTLLSSIESSISIKAALSIEVKTVAQQEVTFSNEANFTSRLQELGFFAEKGAGVHDGKVIDWQTGKTLTIVITDQPQFWPGIYSQKLEKSLSTFSTSSTAPGDIVITVQLDEETKADPDKYSRTLNQVVFIALYKLTHWSAPDDEAYFTFLGNINTELSEKEIALRPLKVSL